LVGIPPLSGFWPKIYLFKETFTTGSWYLLAGMILASLVTLYVIAKMWGDVFWKKKPENEKKLTNDFAETPWRSKFMLVTPVVFLAALSLYIGFFAQRINVLSERVAKELLHPKPYIQAVLGQNSSQSR
jgi:multicomponent Na+:H+ antiporter subunit D